MSKKNRYFEHESKHTWYYVLSALFLILFAPPAYAEIENFQAADVVLGQSNFTARTSGTTQNNLNNPRGISTDGQKLFVVDQTNHRVLIWNSIPTTNNVPADVVIGQPNFTSGTADQGGAAGANTLDLPTSVFSDGRRLFIADRNNSRVLIYNSIPSTNNASADVVVGQPDFTTTAGATNQTTMSGPAGVFSDGKRLFVADRQNRRVLIYNSIPTANGAAADIVIGQPDFTTSSAGTTREKMNFPFGVFFDGQRLFVADTTNHRVLIFNSVPATNGAPADVVIGQPDFTTGSSGAARNKMNQPLAVSSDGKRLLVSDFTNNRVLVYKSIPTSNNTSPDLVLGQPDFATVSAGTTQNKMNQPFGVFSDGKRLFVGDNTNHRVLIFNIAGSSVQLGPQFEQGKAVLGKVFWDWNGNGVQDQDVGATRRVARTNEIEHGIEGVKVVSDTGIYAITDEDGKYHFPFIETGQRVLKIDSSTLPEGARLTTESPRKIIVTEGILTKVSFGVKLPESVGAPLMAPKGKDAMNRAPTSGQDTPLLKVSISQDPLLLNPRLEVSSKQEKDKIIFTITCNYFLFIERAELKLYDQNYKLAKSIPLSIPLPLKYELSQAEIPNQESLFYQLSVFDRNGNEDRTGMGRIENLVKP